MGDAIARHLADLRALSPEALVSARYDKFRAMSRFTE
jgi:acetyl-CoA carboxylase alpha subunit